MLARKFFHPHRFILGVGCHALCGGNMVGDAREFARAAAFVFAAAVIGQSPMNHEIGVTPDRAGEVGVVVFREPEMAERLDGITRALEAFEQTDL